MADIVEKIYNNISMDSYTVSKELQRLYRQMDILWSSVEPALDLETIEKLQEHQARIEGQATLEWFREGIRTGLSLVIESL